MGRWIARPDHPRQPSILTGDPRQHRIQLQVQSVTLRVPLLRLSRLAHGHLAQRLDLGESFHEAQGLRRDQGWYYERARACAERLSLADHLAAIDEGIGDVRYEREGVSYDRVERLAKVLWWLSHAKDPPGLRHTLQGMDATVSK